MYKLFAFDIDGTLLPFGQKEIHDNNIAMLAKLKAKGHTTVLITGRDFVTIGDMVNTPNVDYFIGANGSFIFDLKSKEIIFEESIRHEDIDGIREFCEEHNFNFNITTHKSTYFKDKSECEGNWFWDSFFEDIKHLDHEDLPNERIHQINLYAFEQHDKDLMIQFIDTLPNVEVNTIWERGLFVGPQGINKSKGLQVLGAKLNINLKEMVAFGDSNNDIPMLVDAGLGIAMGNARDSIKEISNDTCDTVEEFGPMKKLVELNLI